MNNSIQYSQPIEACVPINFLGIRKFIFPQSLEILIEGLRRERQHEIVDNESADEDVSNDVNENISVLPNYGEEITIKREPSIDITDEEQVDDITSNEVGNNPACNIHIENQRPSLQDCNEVQGHGVQMDCINEEHNVAANSSSLNTHISSVTLNRCAQQSVDGKVLLKDAIENIPKPNISLATAENVDRDTHITHIAVDGFTRSPQKLNDNHNQPLPLLIKHVQKIAWPNEEEVALAPVIQLFGQALNTVMIYGQVTSLTVEKGGLKQRFVIDDGSGSINVVWEANNEILELLITAHHLDEEVNLCRQSDLSVMNENWQPNSEDGKDMLASLKAIMQITKRQITQRTKLKLFGYAAAVGTLFRSNTSSVELHASDIEDDSRDRSLQPVFKKAVIRAYEDKYHVRSDSGGREYSYKYSCSTNS